MTFLSHLIFYNMNSTWHDTKVATCFFFLFLPSFLAFPLPSFIPLLLSLSLPPVSFPFPPEFFLCLHLPCIPYLSFYLLSFLKDINLTCLYLLIWKVYLNLIIFLWNYTLWFCYFQKSHLVHSLNFTSTM